jgi:hypothetical protein
VNTSGLHSVEFRSDWSFDFKFGRMGWLRWEGRVVRRNHGIRVVNGGRLAVPGDSAAEFESGKSLYAWQGPLRMGRTEQAVRVQLEADKALIVEAYDALRKSTIHVHTLPPKGGVL